MNIKRPVFLFIALLLGCKSEEPQITSKTLQNPPQNLLKDNSTTVVEVKSKTGRIWMDRNLGASQVATSPTDEKAYGDLYQWGRGTDGHQLRNSPITTILSNNDQPSNSFFYMSETSSYDWRSPSNDNLWQGVNGINNPCPKGFRLPTSEEWSLELAIWGSENGTGAYASHLKLPLAGGYRSFVINVSGNEKNGEEGGYWSSSVLQGNPSILQFNNKSNRGTGFAQIGGPYFRSVGFSVRCIKE